MNEETPEINTFLDKEAKFYSFSFSTKLETEGIVSSRLPIDEAKARVFENLEESFGEGQVTMEEFREVSEEEKEILIAQLERSAAPQSALN